MPRDRYTEAQVLCGLREAWQRITGADEPFNTETQIDTYMKETGTWDEIDFADVFRGLEQFFQFGCSDVEWKTFFGFAVAKRSLEEWDRTVARKLTFRALADFIADRAPVTASFDPISVLGIPCAPAGVFDGCQKLIAAPRIAPSTRIIDALRGNALDDFWMRLRWQTENLIPPLPDSWRGITGTVGSVGMVGILNGLTMTWLTSDLTFIILGSVFAAILLIAGLIYKQRTNPLPPNIVTFRDLSYHIVKSREQIATLKQASLLDESL